MTQFLVSAKVAYNKHHLRPLILFLIEKRRSVVGDSNFSFSINELNEFIKRYYKYPSAFPTASEVRSNLNLLKNFKQRDSSLKIINPQQPLLISRPGRNNNFIVSNCYTEYLISALRFIEGSIHLDENGLPLEKNDSFFRLDRNHKITFFGESSSLALGKKEEAIFNYLRRYFNQECDYRELFKAIKIYKKDDPIVQKMLEKQWAGYIRDGINELRKKLYQASGYRLAIMTVKGRASVFKLVY